MVRRRFAFVPLVVAGSLYAACGSDSDPQTSSFGGNGGGSGDGSAAAGGSSGSSSGGDGGSSASSSGGSSANGGAAGGGGSSGSSGNGGSSGSSGSSGNGGSSAGPGDAGFPDVQFGFDAPVVQEDACAAATAEANPIPLDMYIILDKSGSMGSDCNVGSSGSSKWCRAINAMDGFFNDPSSAGNGVALQFFGSTGCNALSTPAEPLGLLPGHATALRNAMNSASPGGNTNTEGALKGLRDFTNANQTPGRKIIGILVTDGDPVGCETNVNTLDNIPDNHFNATGIPTFIIGMTGATFSNLQTLADGAGAAAHTNFCGGGISPCHFYNVGNGDSSAFIAALQAIQASAVGCQFSVPTTDAGIIDFNGVTVEYTPGGTGNPQTITRVNDSNACGAGGGWYYDTNPPGTPQTINLCPSTCQVVEADTSAKIDLQLGCLGS